MPFKRRKVDFYSFILCRERELTKDHIHTFLTTQGHGIPPWMKDQLNAGVTSDNKNIMKDDTHHSHTPVHSNKVNMIG